MARYLITHSCGHEGSVELYGKSDERERRLAWLATQACTACKRASEQAAAEREAATAGLPDLVGTAKQVAWAVRIRAELLGKVAQERERFADLGRRQGVPAERVGEELGRFDAAVERLKAEASAGWWIDRRNRTARELLREVAQ